ncbi:hypothetical protein ACFWBB_09770 [Streptomyces sp. NPDC060000]|uniref:hypothetical protein n=1 Tax=Streptomyces sp. NPDC060000 TaxID=3347031 RepID=UPI0036CBA77C
MHQLRQHTQGQPAHQGTGNRPAARHLGRGLGHLDDNRGRDYAASTGRAMASNLVSSSKNLTAHLDVLVDCPAPGPTSDQPATWTTARQLLS